MGGMDMVAVVVVAVLLQYFYFAVLVGRARVRTGVAAPAVMGDPVFERTLRVQQNTLEQLVIFLPCVALFAHYVSAGVASLLGVLFLVGRALYAAGYIKDPAQRGPGFLITLLAQGALAIGALLGALRAAV